MATRSILSIDIGATNFAVCAVDMPTVVVRNLECWNLGNIKAIPTTAILDRLLRCFQECNFLKTWVPDVVLIEQQIRGAHVNLALAFSTYTYMKTRFPSAIVKFVTPMAKFTGYTAHIDLKDAEILGKIKDKASSSTYAKRKKHAVDIANAILLQTNQPDLQSHCPGLKQDDLADAFLQAFCFSNCK